MEKRRTKTMMMLAVLIFCMCLAFGGEKEVQAAATYQDMTLGQWVKSSVTKEVDTRYYKVVVPSGGYLTLNANSFFEGCDFEIITEDMTKSVISGRILYATASNPRTCEASAWVEKGTYYLRVKEIYSYGDFWAKVSFRAAGNNEIEPNNTYASANTLKLNQEVRGLISKQDSDDYYSFTLTKAQKITLQIKGYNSRTVVQVRNSNLEVIKEGSILYASESDPRGYKEELDLKAGKYYIHIYGNTGYYDLAVKPSTTLASSVVLNRKSAAIYKGNTVKLSAAVSPSNTTNKKVTWSSSNSQVAKVSSAGVVTGVKAGTAKITARTADGTKITASCTVTVKNKTLTVNRSKATLVKGKYCKLTVKGSPTVSAAAKTVKFSTSNSRIATVTSTGKIIAKKAGTCKIYVKGNGITRTVTVTVKNR